ncbi:MAG: DUF4263 domain-containing protein [Candidatus Kerfeldbacteria bacterium]|nr:DUF4263 domain-containing protein [Candidatus Kerfeldbacteria bacterium]
MTKKKGRKNKNGHVTVRSKSYGKALKGLQIYFEGGRPKSLKNDGSITFGKHILEKLKEKFGVNFKWIITADKTEIRYLRNKYVVRTAQKLLSSMDKEKWDRTSDIKHDIVDHFFAAAFPTHFATSDTKPYIPGTLGKMLDSKIIPHISNEDRQALIDFIPPFIASESMSSIKSLDAQAQITTMKGLVQDLENAIQKKHQEAWWQKYIQKNILLLQSGYIKAVGKINVNVGNTKFPDFSLVTHDGYLDILEIKKPDTQLLTFDKSRKNYYWNTEIAKAVIQVENYIDSMSRNSDVLRSHLKDEEKIDLKIVRPRGVILAGNATEFKTQKQKDDFRLLSQGTHRITVVTYDELLLRLKNYLDILERHTRTK